MEEFAFFVGYNSYTDFKNIEKYEGITNKELIVFEKVLLTRDRITLTEYENMPRTEYEIYTTINNEITKGEKHRQKIEEAKQKLKNR
jgi:hypothetical protein